MSILGMELEFFVHIETMQHLIIPFLLDKQLQEIVKQEHLISALQR